MTVLRRTRLLLSALCATLLLGLTVPATSAHMPRATHYRLGGAITLDTNLLSVSGASAWAIDAYLASATPLPRLGVAFIAAERKYGVNARFLLAAALHESGRGTSDIARFKHNLFGYNAYDRDPYRYASAFATYAANINATAKFIHDYYLKPGGRWWGGQPTLRSMQQFWSSSRRWGENVSSVANSIHLDSFSGAAIRAGAPVVAGRLHTGDRASLQVAWTGPTLPAGVEFVATWTPVALDADLIAAASASPDPTNGDSPSPPDGTPAATGSPSPAAAASSAAPATASGAVGAGVIVAPAAPADRPPVRVHADRTRSSANTVTLALAAPRLPGQYQLSLELRDTGATPLPKGELVRIPAVSVRVWGDQSMSIDLATTTDGTGTVVRLTNTGRQPIAAQPAVDPTGPSDPESRAFTTVTVTATTGVAANPVPVVVLATPLRTDLKPGESATFQLPDVVAATGRAGNWLSPTLTVPGDPSWLLAYAPAGAWLANGHLSASVPLSILGLAPGSEFVGPVPPVSPTPSIGPMGSAMPMALPAPPATPTRSPAPTAKPTSAPVKHGTWSYSEHSSAIAYRGAWRDARSAGYSGGNATWSTTPGATAAFTFTGNSVTWIGPMGPTRGRALVRIDGRAEATVSLWRSAFVPQVTLFGHAFRSVGRHTLTIEVLSSPGHPYVAIDGFVVRS